MEKSRRALLGLPLAAAAAAIPLASRAAQPDLSTLDSDTLYAAWKAAKQRELLEDAVVIYRIGRAPDRRVFHIDAGDMPPERVREIVEGVQTEFQRRRAPHALS